MFGFFPRPTGIKYTIDLSKITDRANNRTVEAPIAGEIQEPVVISWGDGTTQTITSGTWHTHTYDSNAGDIFTVIMDSATGHLPWGYFTKDATDTDDPQLNLTLAVVSVDHFNGMIGNGNNRSFGSFFRGCFNLLYTDVRLVGLHIASALRDVYKNCTSFLQSIESFCFDFCAAVSDFSRMFWGCTFLTGVMPVDLFKHNSVCTTFQSVFRECSKITGSTPRLPDSLVDMYCAFMGCSGLNGVITNLPSNIKNLGYAFYECSHLHGDFPNIPLGVTRMDYVFLGCYGLEGALPDVPSGITSIRDSFYQCFGATAFPQSFPSSLTDVSCAFYNCRGLNSASLSAPELWNTTNYPNISQSLYCFGLLNNLANYADIPSGWK